MKEIYMKKAYQYAIKAYEKDEIPVGCIIVKNNNIIAYGYNKKEQNQNSILHAEIIAITKACLKLKTWRLDECELYVTLQPCMMCMGAILESRIKKVYFGCEINSKQMYDINKIRELIDIEYVDNNYCSKILSDFFKNRRKKI